MRNSMTLLMAGAAALWMTGCGSSPTTTPDAEAPAEPVAVEVAGEEMTVELGCGGCIYEMDGVESCITAAKVGETAMLVEGGGVDAHTSGLCQSARMATVVGEVKDGKLYASSITLN